MTLYAGSLKKQSTVVTSTSETEYIAIGECTKKALWIRNILIELFNIKKTNKNFDRQFNK